MMKSASDDSPSPIAKEAKEESVNNPARTNDERFQRMIAEVEDYAIFFLDKEGIISSWNRGAEKIKGYTASEIIGSHYKIFYPKEDRDNGLPDTLLEIATKYGKANHEGWRVRKNGSRFWANITITAVHDLEGNVNGFLKVTRDLTDRKMAEDRMSNFVEELKEKNELLRRSEERYHKMVSEVEDYAIILLDKNGTILDWNKGAEKLKGYTASEIVGKNFRIFYPKEEKEKGLAESLLAKALKNGSVNHEGWRLKKDGSRFWGNISITALYDDNRELLGFSKVTRDLTEKKYAEDRLNSYAADLEQKNENLKRSEERYHLMVAEVKDYAIILLGTDGEVLNWNIGAQMIKGYTAEEIVGKNFRVFYTKEDAEKKVPERVLDTARKQGRSVHEGWRIRKDGSKFWGSVVITALHDSHENIIGFSKVTRDLTEKKQSEEALKGFAAQLDLKNKSLERVNSELSSFAYIASHDLKEPLRKIQTFASRLDQVEELTPKGKDLLDRIRNSSSKMQVLIEDLLSYALVTNGTGKFVETNLNEVLFAVRNDLEVAINEKNAKLGIAKLPAINGIPFQLQQMFQNLLSNSLKFSRPDVQPVINVDSRIISGPDLPDGLSNGHNNYYEISVSDNGIGFEKEFSQKIFGAFERLHSSHSFQGIGLGLAIVKKIVENHGGIIVAEGKPGEGATFFIYLPVLQ